jgi:hypothetical protein
LPNKCFTKGTHANVVNKENPSIHPFFILIMLPLSKISGKTWSYTIKAFNWAHTCRALRTISSNEGDINPQLFRRKVTGIAGVDSGGDDITSTYLSKFLIALNINVR